MKHIQQPKDHPKKALDNHSNFLLLNPQVRFQDIIKFSGLTFVSLTEFIIEKEIMN